MSAKAVIIDCDPGVDDAIALLLALASPQTLEVLAITTVAGNVDAAKTARNARIVRQIAGREDVPVYAGAEEPLLRAPIAASHFHGESGLGAMALFEPAAPVSPGHSVDAIIALVMARPPGTVSVAVTGPMTNLAMAMRLEPSLAMRIDTVAIMGGARREGGNITASAEYNIYADPHAAAVVFGSDARIVALGLDVTHQVRTTPERMAALRALGTDAARASADLLDFSISCALKFTGDPGAPLHDPCTIAWLMAPQLFSGVPAQIRVETESGLTLGHTAVEFRLPDPAAAKTTWITDADAEGVFGLLLKALA